MCLIFSDPVDVGKSMGEIPRGSSFCGSERLSITRFHIRCTPRTRHKSTITPLPSCESTETSKVFFTGGEDPKICFAVVIVGSGPWFRLFLGFHIASFYFKFYAFDYLRDTFHVVKTPLNFRKVPHVHNDSFLLLSLLLQLEELYSIVRALKDFTVYCQKTHEATVEGGMQKMVALMALTLEPAKPLPVLRVPAVIVVEGEGDGDGDGDDDLPATRITEKRPHGDLTDLGRRTHEVVQTSIAKRFFHRYGDGLLKRSHLFDRSMLPSPKMLSLEYLGSFAGSTAGKAFGMKPVSEIVARIHEEVIDILTEAVIELRARAAKAAAAAPAGGDNLSGAKRAKTSHPSAAATQDEQDLRELGLLGDDNGSDNNDGEQPAPQGDAREEARSILKAWLETKVSMRSDRLRKHISSTAAGLFRVWEYRKYPNIS